MSTVQYQRAFDPRRCRHSIEGRVTVLHCHHYATLYTQLADDCSLLDARKLLASVAADTFYQVLKDIQARRSITSVADRIAAAEDYYAFSGLGRLKVIAAGPDSGEAELERSHIDEGWIRKWGRRDKPVNFVTQGYLAATFAAVFDGRPEQYAVKEIASIVAGQERSRFLIARK